MPRKPGRFKRLQKHKLMRIYRRLDRRVQTQSVLRLPRDTVVHVIAQYCEVASGQNFAAHLKGRAHLESFLDGFQFAQFYAHKYCRDAPNLPVSSVWKEVGEFTVRMQRFALLWDFLLLSFARQCLVKVTRQKILEFKTGSTIQRNLVAAGRYWAGTESPFDLVLRPEPKFVNDSLWQACKAAEDQHGQLSYTISPEVFNEFRRIGELALRVHWRFDATWDLGGNTVEEFRTVWITLLALSSIHRQLASYGANISHTHKEDLIDQYLKSQSREQWVADVCSWNTGLTEARVGLIVDDLVFDVSTLFRPDETAPQPFVRLTSTDELLLSRYVLISADPEDTIFRVVYIRRRKLHSKLVKDREGLQIKRVRDLFQNPSFDTFKVKHQTKSTDLDLLLLDQQDNFALSCELKWPMNPRWLKDMDTVKNTLGKGITQSSLCVEWLKTAPQSVLDRTKLTKEQWDKFGVEGIVISERALSGAFVKPHPRIPVINEKIVEILLAAPHSCSLRQLWQTAVAGGYLPLEKVNYDYYSESQPLSLFDYSFHRKKMDLIGKKEFTRADIRVTR